MKPLIAAALLLVLVIPAHAVEVTEEWRDNYDLCQSDVERPNRIKACAAARKVEKQLYQEGMRHYREGLCYRARPYDRSPEKYVWERGYYAQQDKEHNTRDWSHCHPK